MSMIHRGAALSLVWLLLAVPSAIAAKKQKPTPPDQFPPNPLELKTPDPLIPNPNRPLSDRERQALSQALDLLSAQAAAQFAKGDRVGAFDLWHRELRLRRFVGPLSEVQALGRVGEVAWRQNDVNEVRMITQRLDVIQKEQTQDLKVIEALGIAYSQVRSPSGAELAYQKILQDAQKRNDAAKMTATRITLGKLYLNWFNYPKAAQIYQELVVTARAARDRVNEALYLGELSYIYEKNRQFDTAIAAQQQLIESYQKQSLPEKIPAIKLKIADNYQRLNNLSAAEQAYRETYELAQPLLQFGHASDALQKLGVLYRKNNRLDSALRVYNFLVGIEQQSYNYMGIMTAYDQLGQIYLEKKNPTLAIVAFQRGLEVAKRLKYREDYFNAQLQAIPQPK